MACPKCGSEEPFRILGTALFIVNDDGSDEFKGLEWENTSSCTCIKCGHYDLVIDFVKPVTMIYQYVKNVGHGIYHVLVWQEDDPELQHISEPLVVSVVASIGPEIAFDLHALGDADDYQYYIDNPDDYELIAETRISAGKNVGMTQFRAIGRELKWMGL